MYTCRELARSNPGGELARRSRRAPVNAAAAAETELRKIDRRALLRAGAFAAGFVGASAAVLRAAQDAAQSIGQSGSPSIGATIGESAPDWMKTPGRSFSGYGMPSHWEGKVQRSFPAAAESIGIGASRTPLDLLAGTITPNGLHFERHHNGIPDIDPARHELVIHGMVKQPLAFSRETLLRSSPWSRRFTSSSVRAIAERSVRPRRSRARRAR